MTTGHTSTSYPANEESSDCFQVCPLMCIQGRTMKCTHFRLGGCRPPDPWRCPWGGFAPPTSPKESAFGLHAPHTKASGETILLLSAKDMICQLGSDIWTSCPTYDESACPIYDEKNQVSENKTGRTVGRAVGRSGGRSGCRSCGRSGGLSGGQRVGRSGRRSGGRSGGRAVGRSVGRSHENCVHFFVWACMRQHACFLCEQPFRHMACSK